MPADLSSDLTSDGLAVNFSLAPVKTEAVDSAAASQLTSSNTTAGKKSGWFTWFGSGSTNTTPVSSGPEISSVRNSAQKNRYSVFFCGPGTENTSYPLPNIYLVTGAVSIFKNYINMNNYYLQQYFFCWI